MGLTKQVADSTLESVSFDELYWLFQPGDFVFSSEDGVEQLYQVYSVDGGRQRLSRSELRGVRNIANGDDDDESAGSAPGTWTSFNLSCYMMVWDGQHFRTLTLRHRMDYFPGERRVTDLEFYPLRFLSDADERLTRLKERGQQYASCYGHKRYEGSSLQPPPLQDLFRPRGMLRQAYRPPTILPEAIKPTTYEDVQSDVYIDTSSFFRSILGVLPDHHLERWLPNRRETIESQPGYRERDSALGDQEVDESRTQVFLASHRHLGRLTKPEAVRDLASVWQLLPSQIPAYIFRSRQWSEYSAVSRSLRGSFLMRNQSGWQSIKSRTSIRARKPGKAAGTTSSSRRATESCSCPWSTYTRRRRQRILRGR